jgi:hypothetical protein
MNIEDYQHLKGSDFIQSREELKDDEIILREVYKDGNYPIIAKGYNRHRINVETKDGFIIAVVGIG